MVKRTESFLIEAFFGLSLLYHHGEFVNGTLCFNDKLSIFVEPLTSNEMAFPRCL